MLSSVVLKTNSLFVHHSRKICLFDHFQQNITFLTHLPYPWDVQADDSVQVRGVDTCSCKAMAPTSRFAARTWKHAVGLQASFGRVAARHGGYWQLLMSSRCISTEHPSISPAEIMGTSANKAFRYIFLRTLPLRSQPEYEHEAGVDSVVADIEHSALRVLQAHAHRAVDERAKTHLHAAALAVATHRVLFPRLKDETRVIDMLRGAFGAGKDVEADAKLPGYWFGKAALLFSPDKMGACRKMTANAAKDFGETFALERIDENEGKTHVMRVAACLYADVCAAEGVPHLTRIFCSLDRALFSHVDRQAHGVEFSISDKTLADGKDSPCEFIFREQG